MKKKIAGQSNAGRHNGMSRDKAVQCNKHMQQLHFLSSMAGHTFE